MNQPLLQMDFRLVVAAIVVLSAAVVAIWYAGRKLRGELGPSRSADVASTVLDKPTSIAKELQARGLVTPAQLATMTATERELLFTTMAGAMTRGADTADSPRISGARPIIRPDELPTIFCPLCSYHIEQFSSTPPLTGQCETCGTKIIVRKDGTRLMLTVLPSSAR